MKRMWFLSLLMPLTGAAASLSDLGLKGALLKHLNAQSDKSAGLYAISGDQVTAGAHSLELTPVVEAENADDGKNVVAMRIEVTVDRLRRPSATFGAIGIGDSRPEAIAVGLGEWYLGFGQALFQALAEKRPLLSLAGYEVFPGTFGLRGGAPTGWVNGSDATKQKVLEVVRSFLPGQPDFVTLNLMIVVPATGPLKGESRINGNVSGELTAALAKLDWPRQSTAYIYKQAFILKRKPE